MQLTEASLACWGKEQVWASRATTALCMLRVVGRDSVMGTVVVVLWLVLNQVNCLMPKLLSYDHGHIAMTIR